MHAAVYLEVGMDTYTLDSTDRKTKFAIQRSGPQIFGLNRESRVILKPELQPEMVRRVKKQIQNA